MNIHINRIKESSKIIQAFGFVEGYEKREVTLRFYQHPDGQWTFIKHMSHISQHEEVQRYCVEIKKYKIDDVYKAHHERSERLFEKIAEEETIQQVWGQLKKHPSLRFALIGKELLKK